MSVTTLINLTRLTNFDGFGDIMSMIQLPDLDISVAPLNTNVFQQS